MTGALLLVAAAVLALPDRSPAARLQSVRGLPRLRGLLDRPPRWSPVMTGCAAAGIGAVSSTPLVAVLAGGCAVLGHRALRGRRRGAREATALLALAEALGVLVAELASGRPTSAAAAAAAAACPDEATARALTAAVTAADQPGEAERPSAPALERIRAATRLSARTGCSLTAVLSAIEDDLRARHHRLLELHAATAGPRASAAVLAGLPVVGLAMGSGIGAHPWAVLTATPAGQVLLAVGVVLEVAGVLWVSRLIGRAGGPAGDRG